MESKELIDIFIQVERSCYQFRADIVNIDVLPIERMPFDNTSSECILIGATDYTEITNGASA